MSNTITAGQIKSFKSGLRQVVQDIDEAEAARQRIARLHRQYREQVLGQLRLFE